MKNLNLNAPAYNMPAQMSSTHENSNNEAALKNQYYF